MILRLASPADRMNRLEFSAQSEHLDHSVDIGFYVCPHCSYSLEFRTSDFERHELSKTTNLDSETAEAFSQFRPVDSKQWEHFLDFRCPGCARPVRLVFESTAEYSMGSHGWRVRDIVEVRDGYAGA
jgi:hypothetical protein